MKRVPILAGVLLAGSLTPAGGAPIVADFKAFAAKEAPRIQKEFGSALSTNPRGVRGPAIGGFDAMLTRYSVNLKPTDSPVWHYEGAIEIYGRFMRSRNGDVFAQIVPYRVRYARQEGKWILDPDSMDPGKAIVEGKEQEFPLGPEWIPYATGKTDTPPGPLPQ